MKEGEDVVNVKDEVSEQVGGRKMKKKRRKGERREEEKRTRINKKVMIEDIEMKSMKS